MSSRDSTLLLKVAEEEVVTEEAKPESESAVEVPKATEEESPAAIEEKEPATESNTTSVTEIPPPLPSSPPPVETPVVPAPTIVETPVVPAPTIVETPVVPTPTIVETPAPIQPVEPEVEQAEPEDETVGGGEGLADPPEGLNTSDIEKEIAAVPLVNGNHVEEEKSDSLDIKCLADKIEAIKLSNAADISEVTNELSNDIHVNGVCDAVAVTTSGNDAGSD